MHNYFQGNILDDEVLINTLAQSKVTSDVIKIKVAEAEKTEIAIDETREACIIAQYYALNGIPKLLALMKSICFCLTGLP